MTRAVSWRITWNMRSNSSAKADEPETGPDAGKNETMPFENRKNPMRNENCHFSRTDPFTVVISAESGGKPWGDPIPVGNYDILDHPKVDFLRLEPLDSHYGDDKDETTGRTKFRLHKPGRTIGCIAAKEKSPWEKLRDLIRKTKTTTTQVDNKYFNPFAPAKETINKFGELRVIDTSQMMIIPPGMPPKP